MNISTHIGTLKLKNPVTVASGTFGHAEKYYNLEAVKRLGALIPKTITLFPREGNLPPRIVETPAGMLNAIGIENVGVDSFIEEKLPLLKKIGIPLIISISGHSREEFLELTKRLDRVKGVGALELNLSCPNLGSKRLIAQDPKATYRIVKAVKKTARLPIVAKLSPNVTDITEIALAAQNAGADGISMINTFSGMMIDVDKRRFMLGNITGGLSGPAIRPLAVKMVYETSKKVKIPIIAMGGIMTARDAIEFFLAGASIVAVGTANFINPKVSWEVLNGIRSYMKKNKMHRLKDLIGGINKDA